jgi:hypothetical protein
LNLDALSQHCGPESRNFPPLFLGITSETPLTDTDCKGLPLPENVWSPRGGTAVHLFDKDSKYGDVTDLEDVIAAFQRLPAAP